MAGPPSSAGVTKKPSDSRKTKVTAVATPRAREGQEHAPERRQPRGAETLAGAQQRGVDPHQGRVDRQHRVGQEDVNHADHDARRVEEERQRLLGEARPGDERG